MQEPQPASPHEVRTARVLVGVQFLLLALLVLLPAGADWPVPGWLVVVAALAGLGGLAVMALGAAALGRGLTAVPLPNAQAQLRTSGPYALVRHPIYSGLLAVGAAIAVVSGSVVRLVVYGLLVALLTIKARWEERRLVTRFPGYAAYAALTPRFVPLLRRR